MIKIILIKRAMITTIPLMKIVIVKILMGIIKIVMKVIIIMIKRGISLKKIYINFLFYYKH